MNLLLLLERFRVRAAIVVLCVAFLPLTCRAAIRYEVSLAHPEHHLFRVTMLIPDVAGEVTVQLPAWNALYQIRDFSSHLQDVEAFVGAERVPLLKMDKLTWRITAAGTVRVQYASYWDEPGPFSTQLSVEHAFINPAMILMYVVGSQKEKAALSFGDFPREWQAESALLEGCKVVFDQPVCREEEVSYDELVDAPIEIGKLDEFDLPGVSPPITVAVHGDNWQRKKIEELLTRICQYQLRLMEGAPFEHYTFILHIGKSASGAGGGMEHANSTAIYAPSDEFLAGVAAHEFFHLWNVKRIRPASLEPVDYSKEQYSRALWFAEGVTNMYASYTLMRTGIWSRQQFYADLGEQISELEARPANRWQSAEESSLDAWLEKYALYNQPDMSVSYYTKGQILGALLDILIRDASDNRKSLDDVMRELNANFARQGKFYRESADIRGAAEKIASGTFEEFFHKYVGGTSALPYDNILDLAGLTLRKTPHKRATLGFMASRDTGTALMVRSVDTESFAAKAGLRAGDVILKWNNGELPRRPERWALEQNPGNLLRLTMRREEKEVTLEFRLGEMTETYFQMEENPRAGEKARRIREGLLRGETQAASSN